MQRHSAKTKDAPKARKTGDRRLIHLVGQRLEQAIEGQTRLEKWDGALALQLAEHLAHYRPLVQQVIDQTRSRLLDERAAPAEEKLVSLFEPYTAIIHRGKPKETELVSRVWVVETEGGIVTEWQILEVNPSDMGQVLPSVRQQERPFGHALQELSGDRGLQSAANKRGARKLGVKRVYLPKYGHNTARRRRGERQH